MLSCRKQYCFNLFIYTCCCIPIFVPRTSPSFFERIAFGVLRSLDPTSSAGTTNDSEGRGDADAVDLDLFCEVYFNSVLSGRTVVKRSTGSPDWHETFLFTDLPPFEKLAVVVWREKKLQKPSVIGTVYITLTNFRRGEPVEGWFPVLSGGATTASTQAGLLRLKLRLDESVISSKSSRSPLLNDDPGKSCYLTPSTPK